VLQWSFMSRLVRGLLVVALAGSAAAGALALRKRAPELPLRPADRVFFLGFDGADPDLIEPLVAQGKLPAIERLMAMGTYGRLRSFSPTKSAILWTSVATGKTMLKHGIIDWTYVNKVGLQVPFEDRSRKVKTYWEILSERGVTTGTLNWWMSYPPPPIINGYIVSNAFRHTLEPHTVHPQRLFPLIAPLKLNREDALEEMRRQGMPAWRKQDATLPLHGAREVLDAYPLYVSQDLTVDRVSDYLFATQPVEVFSTYFRLVDVTSHFAVHFVDRKLYAETVALEDAGRLTPEATQRMDTEFARVLTPLYQLMDRTIAKYLARMDDRTVLIVSSDHGFDFYRGNYAHAHHGMQPPDGVLFCAGPGFKQGSRLKGATLFDIAPTILYSIGQPVPSDMDGTLLTAALEPDELPRCPMRSIASYESQERQTASGTAASAIDDKVPEDLKTLGYIQGGGDIREGKTEKDD